MKIGIDIRTLMDSQYSGVSEYTLNLVREILKLDSENEYRLFYNSAKDISGRMPKFNYPNVKIVKKNIPNKILNYIFFKCLNRPKIDKLFGDIDVFFMPHINFISTDKMLASNASGRDVTEREQPVRGIQSKAIESRTGCLRSASASRPLARRVPSILTIHDLSFLRFPEYFSFRKNFWHKMINVKKLVKKFDKIIAVSESTKNDIVELCDVAPEKVEVIYSGIEKEFRRLSPSDIKNLLSSDIRGGVNPPSPHLLKGGIMNLPEKFILFLGTVEPRKNIEGLIGAYNKYRGEAEVRHRVPDVGLHEYKLVIAGGRGWKSEGIYKKWKESKYKDDIKFLGYVDKKDKVCLYNLASLFVYPSFYEGFGFPPLEAMACGTPVITSFTSSLPEIVGNAGLMVDPYNITDIASAMEQVLNDEELKNNLIQKGLERAKMFNWEKAARELFFVIKNYQS